MREKRNRCPITTQYVRVHPRSDWGAVWNVQTLGDDRCTATRRHSSAHNGIHPRPPRCDFQTLHEPTPPFASTTLGATGVRWRSWGTSHANARDECPEVETLPLDRVPAWRVRKSCFSSVWTQRCLGRSFEKAPSCIVVVFSFAFVKVISSMSEESTDGLVRFPPSLRRNVSSKTRVRSVSSRCPPSLSFWVPVCTWSCYLSRRWYWVDGTRLSSLDGSPLGILVHLRLRVVRYHRASPTSSWVVLPSPSIEPTWVPRTPPSRPSIPIFESDCPWVQSGVQWGGDPPRCSIRSPSRFGIGRGSTRL